MGSPPPGQAGCQPGSLTVTDRAADCPTWQQQGLGAAMTPQPTTSAVELATASDECSTAALDRPQELAAAVLNEHTHNNGGFAARAGVASLVVSPFPLSTTWRC